MGERRLQERPGRRFGEVKCPECDGEGSRVVFFLTGFTAASYMYCPKCDGAGWVKPEPTHD